MILAVGSGATGKIFKTGIGNQVWTSLAVNEPGGKQWYKEKYVDPEIHKYWPVALDYLPQGNSLEIDGYKMVYAS